MISAILWFVCLGITFILGVMLGARVQRRIHKAVLAHLMKSVYEDIKRRYVLVPRHHDITVETVDEETGETRKGRARVSDLENADKGNGYPSLPV